MYNLKILKKADKNIFEKILARAILFFINIFTWIRYELPLVLSSMISSEKGTSDQENSERVIVSLTSIPPRLNKLHLTIASVMRQSVKSSKIILWLSHVHNNREFEDIDRDGLPKKLLALESRGLEIKFTDDIGPYRKLIPTAKEFQGTTIVTVDDDVIYPKDWLKQMLEVHKEHPDEVLCYRGHEMEFVEDEFKPYDLWHEYHGTESSFKLFPTGKDGVLYPSNYLDETELFNQKMFMKHAPLADDIWFKAISLLRGIKCRKVDKDHTDFPTVSSSQKHSLFYKNIGQSRNDVYLRKVFNYFEIDINKLKKW